MRHNLKAQYDSGDRLDARIELHRRCSTNPIPFHRWIFDHMDLDGKRILEVGCGTCELWLQNRERIPTNCGITLVDFSEAMVDCAKDHFGEDDRFTFAQADIQALPFEDRSFDVVITNHMLYHVPDIHKGLCEVKRVLAPQGISYATTNDEKSMQGFYNLLTDFDSAIDVKSESPNLRFNTHNGQAMLEKVFDDVVLMDYENPLHITDADLLVNYVLSMKGVTNMTEMIAPRMSQFQAYLEDMIQSDGKIVLPKRAGMFTNR